MKRFYDLRFVIGIFFLVVGILLVAYGVFSSASEGMYVNKWCGIIFIAFSVFMLILSIKKPVE